MLFIHGDMESYRASLGRMAALFTTPNANMPAIRLPAGVTSDDLARLLVWALPFGMALGFVFFTAGNLWLAAKATRVSGRLVRPWPSIAEIRMPRESLALLVMAAVMALALSDFGGLLAAAMLGALTAAFTLSGLAAIHTLTRDHKARPMILAGLYGLLIVMMTLMLPVLAVTGLIDTAFDLRRGKGPPPQVPPQSPGPTSPWG
jgi:small-conductance mechanosensitive channel